MSPRYAIIPGDAVYDTSLTDFDLRVLAALGRHSDNHGWCFVNQGKMAEKLGRNRSSVNRTIKKLCEKGYVQKEDMRSIMHGERQQNICFYRVMMDRHAPPETLVREPDSVHDPIDAETGLRLSKLAKNGLNKGFFEPLCAQSNNTLCAPSNNTTTPFLTTPENYRNHMDHGQSGDWPRRPNLNDAGTSNAPMRRDPHTGEVRQPQPGKPRSRDAGLYTGNERNDEILMAAYSAAFDLAEDLELGIDDGKLKALIRRAAGDRVARHLLSADGLHTAKAIIARILEVDGHLELEDGTPHPDDIQRALELFLGAINGRVGRRKGEWLNHWSLIALRFSEDETDAEAAYASDDDEAIPF